MATTAEIVIIPAAGLADVAHVSELVDDQVVFEDITPANCTMPLGAVIPKLKPETVTDSPVPEPGTFTAADAADAGAPNENIAEVVASSSRQNFRAHALHAALNADQPHVRPAYCSDLATHKELAAAASCRIPCASRCSLLSFALHFLPRLPAVSSACLVSRNAAHHHTHVTSNITRHEHADCRK